MLKMRLAGAGGGGEEMIDEIYNALVEFEKRTFRKPTVIYLGYDEVSKFLSDKKIMKFLNMNCERGDEVFGVPIIKVAKQTYFSIGS